MDKIANYKEMIKKETTSKKSKEDKMRSVKNTATGAVGLGALQLSKDRILGQKTLYHGTNEEAWDSIKKEGLKANQGGLGGVSSGKDVTDEYREMNKNHIHVTGDKLKAEKYKKKAQYNEEMRNARQRWIDSRYVFDKYPNSDEIKDYVYKGKGRKKGKNMKIKMSYDKYKDNFEIPPFEKGRKYIGKGDLAERFGKHIAARGQVDIGTDEIIGLHKNHERLGKTIKNMPDYIKNNKGRFGTGVALAGAGSIMVGHSVKDSIKARKENKINKVASYKEEIFKVASSNQEENENRTKWVKDRVAPAMKSERHALKGGAIGAGIGAAGAVLGSQATSMLTKQIVKKKGMPTPDSAIYKAFTAPQFRKARLGVSAAMGAANLAPKGAKTGRVVGDMKDLEKQTRAELHREPTEKEYKNVARLNDNNAFDRKLGRLINNPNAIVKSNLREKQLNKVANDTEAIFKAASNAVGRPDYSKAKTIHANIDDYTIRDARVGEKVVHGAHNAYTVGKKGVHIGAACLKKNPKARKVTLVTASMPAAGYFLEKSTDKNRKADAKRHYSRDVLAPDMARELKLAPLAPVVTGVGFVAGIKGNKAGRELAKQVIIKNNIRGEGKANAIMKGGAKIGQASSIIGATTAGFAVKSKIQQNMVHNKLDKLSEKHLGRKATDAEHKKIDNAYGAYQGAKMHDITPESEVQKRRRQRVRYQQRKKTASEYLDEICKEASSKWSKEDKKGYAKNVAIGVTQDFLNAGNPLNIGSSIVGSVADSLILERASLNLNKKAKAQEASKSKADAFNNALNIKNGTALPRVVDKKIK